MKSIISISFGFVLLISHAFGSDADSMEGAVGEAEAMESFFEEELTRAVANAEHALIELKSYINKGSTGVVSSLQDLAINRLKENVQALEELFILLDHSKASAAQMRTTPEGMSKDSAAKNVRG